MTPTLGHAMNCDGEMVQAYGYEIGDTFVVNARISECGRFKCSPAAYGLTDMQADELEALNALRGLLAFDALSDLGVIDYV